MKPNREMREELLAEARRYPGGWVYEIAPGYNPDDAVPREAILGAWKVDLNGEPVGDFISNPYYGVPKPDCSNTE